MLGFGLSANVNLVWTTPAQTSGAFRGGAALSEADPNRASAWRRFVDAVA